MKVFSVPAPVRNIEWYTLLLFGTNGARLET